MKRKTYLKPILLKFIVTDELFMDGKFRWLVYILSVNCEYRFEVNMEILPKRFIAKLNLHLNVFKIHVSKDYL